MTIHHFNRERELAGDTEADVEPLWCPLEGAGVFSDDDGCCDTCGSDLIQPVVLAAIRAEAYAAETLKHVAAAEAAVRADAEIARLRAELAKWTAMSSGYVAEIERLRAELASTAAGMKQMVALSALPLPKNIVERIAEQEKTIAALVKLGSAMASSRTWDGTALQAEWRAAVVAATKGEK